MSFDERTVFTMFDAAMGSEAHPRWGGPAESDGQTLRHAMQGTAHLCAEIADQLTNVADGIDIAKVICALFEIPYPTDRDPSALEPPIDHHVEDLRASGTLDV